MDRVYLSRDASLDFTDTLLYEQEIRSGLDIEQPDTGTTNAYTVTKNVTLPENIEGDFHLLVFTDSNIRGTKLSNSFGTPEESLQDNLSFDRSDRTYARIAEFQDEGNNVTEVPLKIVLQEPPDIQVTKVEIPERATVGQSFPLKYTVSNLGDGQPTQSSWRDEIYLSRDRFLDLRSDRYIGSEVHRGGFPDENKYTVEKTVKLPTDLSGPYYVFVISDPNRNGSEGEVFEGGLDFNNSLPSTQPLSLDFPPPADLQVENIQVPNSALSGDKVKLEYTVKNHGPNAATGAWSDAFYLSTDAIWDINDQPLGKVEQSGTVDSGESYPGEIKAVLPPAAPGEYRIIVRPDIFNRICRGSTVITAVCR